MTADDRTPKESSAWNWPAEWAVERAFWREVGTRTLSGVLTVIILGVPGLIYGLAFGLLTLDQAAPILIGLVLFLLVLIIYVIVLRSIRRSERKKIAQALRPPKKPSRADSSPIPSPEVFLSYTPEQRERIFASFGAGVRDQIREAENTARSSTLWATVGAGVSAVAVATIGALMTFLLP